MIRGLGDRARALRRLKDRWRSARLLRVTERALTPPPPWSFAAHGAATYIVPPARVENPALIAIGNHVVVHEHAWLMARGGGGNGAPRITIGDRVSIARFVKIVAADSVHLGDGVIVGDRVYVSDVEYEPGDFGVDPARRPLTEPRPVVIQAGALLGVGVVVKPGVTIGERAYIGAGSIVTEDVPPHSVAVGSPAKVVRRFGPEVDSP